MSFSCIVSSMRRPYSIVVDNEYELRGNHLRYYNSVVHLSSQFWTKNKCEQSRLSKVWLFYTCFILHNVSRSDRLNTVLGSGTQFTEDSQIIRVYQPLQLTKESNQHLYKNDIPRQLISILASSKLYDNSEMHQYVPHDWTYKNMGLISRSQFVGYSRYALPSSLQIGLPNINIYKAWLSHNCYQKCDA